MGEIADYYNEFNDFRYGEPEVQCKYCKADNLVWEMTPAGWRLFEHDGELHNCNNPFKILEELECK